MPAEQDLDRAGQTLGNYQLLRRLGRGGMADVYLAQQASLDRPVALKILKPALASDASYVRRFHNEAKAAAALIHPNIVQIYEVGELDGVHFIAQEYVAGKTLKQLIDGRGSFPAGEAVSLLRQVAAAMHKSHQLQIVHRDIKPENILVDQEGVAKVADFGLAKQHAKEDMALTSDGTTMGTPYYMSPEQVQGQAVDSRSDIYSLGVTAFQMLTGRLPYEGETPMSVALKQVNTPAPSVRSIDATLPIELCQLVDQMMAKQPEERPTSAAELSAKLQDVSRQLGSEDRTLPAASSAAIAEAERGATPSSSRAVDDLAAALAGRRSNPTTGRKIATWLAWAGAFLLGALLANSLIQPDPLAGLTVAVTVPRKESPRQQFLYATYVNTKEAWQAVLDYYPADGTAERQRYYAMRAKTGLASWHLESGEPENARSVFQELADLDATEKELRAIGLAGLALSYEAENNLAEAADCLSDVSPLRNELNNTTQQKLRQLSKRLQRTNQ